MLGPILDWGCGQGYDVMFLRNAYGYDPNHQPNLPPDGEQYNTVLCTYFLDTILNYHDRCVVMGDACDYLADYGWIYVSIHKDDNLMVFSTTKQQEEVSDQLKRGGFTLVRSTGDTEIWGWQKIPHQWEQPSW